MVLKNVFIVVSAAALLGLNVSALAQEYRPDEFLGLDLSTAVLSPKRLGPPAEFAPVSIEAKGDPGGGPPARAEPKTVRAVHPRPAAHAEPKTARAGQPRPATRAEPKTAHAVHPRPAARAQVAKRRGNPLDAQARDTRIQTWPCKSGGICNWQ